MSGILAWANATRTSLFFYKSVHASYPRLKNSWRSLSLKLDQGAYSSINWIRWRELISDKIFDSSLLSLGVVIFATGENELFVRSKSKWLLHSAFLAPEAGIPKPVVLNCRGVSYRCVRFFVFSRGFDGLQKWLWQDSFRISVIKR